VDLYPKGKYIHFKPDTKDWFGGIPAVGLGLTKVEQRSGDRLEDQAIWDVLGPKVDSHIGEEVSRVHAELIAKVPRTLLPKISPLLAEKIKAELKARIADLLRSQGNGDWRNLYETYLVSDRENILSRLRSDISDLLQTKVAGDQRENLLDMWMASLAEKGVKVNEYESCRSVSRANDGDYFLIDTQHGPERSPVTYTARRVVIAIGLRGSPNKLRLPNEEMVFRMDGHDQPKVMYGLSTPEDFWGSRIAVVGGGNVAVEAAVDLVARREGAAIKPRAPEKMNKVTLLVRDYLAPTVQFGNKYLLYKCADEGLIDLRFGVAIKEIREDELVLEDVKTKTTMETIPNDFVFALIGGERPNRFLESIGITIN
jgi:thioredoxin reductase